MFVLTQREARIVGQLIALKMPPADAKQFNADWIFLYHILNEIQLHNRLSPESWNVVLQMSKEEESALLFLLRTYNDLDACSIDDHNPTEIVNNLIYDLSSDPLPF